MQQQYTNYCVPDEFDEELKIDFKKIFFAIWSRKFLLVKVFAVVFVFFILTTFTSAKKYVVDADLYINKSNNSNMAEINPYVISELGAGGGMAALMSGGGSLANEIEIMQSPLVINKVIQENDLRYKKVYGIFPTKKTGQYLTAEAFLKKGISFTNKKGTNIVSIIYKTKKPELGYSVVNSIITHYIELQKELNAEKSKSDIKILENEYNKAKADLEKKIKSVSGIPSTAMTGAGNITALSAFSSSARSAMSNLQGQYVAGERSKLAVTEDAARVAQLSTKLEWAKLVDEMSTSSKVVVLKEPRLLKDYEQSSPKLFMNIILGIVFGVIAALIALIYSEVTDKKLTYSMLGDEIIYNFNKNFDDLKIMLLSKSSDKITFVNFERTELFNSALIKEFKNANIVDVDISEHFIKSINASDAVILVVSIGKTNSKLYKQVKDIVKNSNKQIIKEILV